MRKLLGRHRERREIENLLARAHTGDSGVLVVHGVAGIGKTALLDDLGEHAERSGFRVESSTGVEAEASFAFAGLHQLCAPFPDARSALPEPQRIALGVALGERSGPAPEKFLVGLATLNLLAEVSEQRPLLCFIDDAQWLDQESAEVLAFVARRLGAERLAMVFALRHDGEVEDHPLAGLPVLRLGGLEEADARELLTRTLGTPLDLGVVDRIVPEAQGNPLALLEFPLSAPPVSFAGGFELPPAADIPRRVEDSFLRRSRTLPTSTRLMLLIAAAEPTGDPATLWRAAEALGLAPSTAAPAETAGLVEIDTRVRFRHPLVRSAVYRSATLPDRRRAHRALARATDAQAEPDRRAWHRAMAAIDVDEEVAEELERSAERASARGGMAASAAFLKHATRLTPDPAARARRALDAAQAMLEAGAPEDALDLLAIASDGPGDDLQRARIMRVRSQIAFHTTRGGEAPQMLLDAARTLAPLDAAQARETCLQAIEASFHAGRLGEGRGGLLEAAQEAQAIVAPAQATLAIDHLLDGMILRFTQGFEASVATLQLALQTLRERDDDRRFLWLACHAAAMLWDDEAIFTLAARDVRLARESGAVSSLPGALNALASVLVLTGDITEAAELIAEEQAMTRAAGVPPLPNARLILAAWRGQQQETMKLYSALVEDATLRGEGATLGLGQVALAALHNGLGDYERALAAATPPCEHDELAYSSIALPELIEAAVGAGRSERAAEAMDQLSSRARASGTQWARGLEARSRALLTVGSLAEGHYREAIERLRACRMATHLARAYLVYGEWLRRQERQDDAREQLRMAHELFADMGAEAFAARAARELRAAGEHPRRRTVQPVDELTPQEMHVARLVATGATSREVGAQLFLSPRTIDAHLRNIFRKLGIASRRQLKDIRLP